MPSVPGSVSHSPFQKQLRCRGPDPSGRARDQNSHLILLQDFLPCSFRLYHHFYSADRLRFDKLANMGLCETAVGLKKAGFFADMNVEIHIRGNL